jgi:hypothetical protein
MPQKLFEMHDILRTKKHLESDGQTERVNQCLKIYLRCMTFLEPKNGYLSYTWLNGGTTQTTILLSSVHPLRHCMVTLHPSSLK